MKKKTIRCKACGYLMAEGSDYTECPACGVPSKMFEPYDDKVPEERAWLLRFDLHGVVAHLPMGLTIITFVLSALSLLLGIVGPPSETLSALLTTLVVSSIILPVVVLGTYGAGLLDGYFRYKKVTTKLLVKKIYLGAVFLVFSVAMLIVSQLPGFTSSIGLQVVYLAINLAAFACIIFLGLWGASLVHGVMPGPWVKKKKPAKPGSAAPEAPAAPAAGAAPQA